MADVFPDSFRSDLDGVSAELERIGDLADGVARSINTAFRGAIIDGKSLKSVLADVAGAFADIALKAALKPLGNLISGAVEGLFSATNPVLAGVTPFAKGGVIAAPTIFRSAAAWGWPAKRARRRSCRSAAAAMAGSASPQAERRSTSVST
jgi:phage-related minor tail protein